MTREQTQLVVDGRKLVQRVASKLKNILPKSIERDELVGAGNLGLVRAALKFDPSRGVPFAVYARLRIRGEMLDHLRDNGRVSRRDRAAGIPEAIVVSVEEWADNGPGRVGETLEDSRPGPAMRTGSQDASNAIAKLFDGRERRVFGMLYIDGFSQRMIAAILGCSGGRISQIVAEIRKTVWERVGEGFFATAG